MDTGTVTKHSDLLSDSFTAPGADVMDRVVIERESESTIMFVEGARTAYFGYITIKVKLHVFSFYSSVHTLGQSCNRSKFYTSMSLSFPA